MLRRIIAATIFSVFMLACQTSQEKLTAADSAEIVKPDNTRYADPIGDTSFAPVDTVGAEHTASTAIDYVGTYAGVLPCDDCKGIETTLILKEDKQYILERKYLGKSDKTFSTTGAWQWLNGNVMRLSSSQSIPTLIFISENKVMMLDASGNRISGDLADQFNLKKVQ